eukprot:COSAG06_NODE_8986_length_2018_cov_1.478895_1_plen_87_part_00
MDTLAPSIEAGGAQSTGAISAPSNRTEAAHTFQTAAAGEAEEAEEDEICPVRFLLVIHFIVWPSRACLGVHIRSILGQMLPEIDPL